MAHGAGAVLGEVAVAWVTGVVPVPVLVLVLTNPTALPRRRAPRTAERDAPGQGVVWAALDQRLRRGGVQGYKQ